MHLADLLIRVRSRAEKVAGEDGLARSPDSGNSAIIKLTKVRHVTPRPSVYSPWSPQLTGYTRVLRHWLSMTSGRS
jgi:hypothetical protein